MSALTDIADLAVTRFGLTGINWDALGARASVWDRDYIDQYLSPAMAQATLVIGSLQLDLQASIEDMLSSYSVNQDLLQAAGDSVLGALQLPTFTEMQMQVQLSREAMIYSMSHIWAGTLVGYGLHYDETIHHSGQSDADIKANADKIMGTFNAIILLDRLKFFDVMGMKVGATPSQALAPTSGLGLAPAVIAGIVIVAVAAVCAAAWVIVNAISIFQTNKIVADVCKQAQTSGDSATAQSCVKTLSDANLKAATAIPQTINVILKELVPYALGGAALYALYLSMPWIVKNIFSTKATT